MILAYSILTLLIYSVVVAEFSYGIRRMRRLKDQPTLPPSQCPPISVVIAARNEAPHIREALHSILGQDYPNLEIIVVNDRSTDATGSILDRMAEDHENLRVLHITELPEGWLGKNHALHQGFQAARGEYILFTDADIHLESLALSRAAGLMEREGLDHLSSGPDIESKGLLLRMAVDAFSFFFLLGMRPWRVNDPRRSEHLGIGAFNLVRRSALELVGGLELIRLRPDDDLKLGKILKRNGARQENVYGQDVVMVEWYPSLKELFRGLEKNVFAGFEYSLKAVAVAEIVLLLFFVLPFAMVFLTGGAAQIVFALAILMMLGLQAGGLLRVGRNPLSGILMPFGFLLFVLVIANAVWKTLRRGGIQWRDTFYPLEELRRNRV